VDIICNSLLLAVVHPSFVVALLGNPTKRSN